MEITEPSRKEKHTFWVIFQQWLTSITFWLRQNCVVLQIYDIFNMGFGKQILF